jgi:hypothetical protein
MTGIVGEKLINKEKEEMKTYMVHYDDTHIAVDTESRSALELYR